MNLRLVVALLMCCTISAQTPPATQSSLVGQVRTTNSTVDESSLPKVPSISDANPEVVQLAVQDQWDRGNDLFGGREIPLPNMNGKTVEQRDGERETAIRRLLAEGKVKSGSDFWFSALILQHSQKAEGIMLAHVLAVTAVAKGNRNGRWLAAASLDRYLWDTHQPQTFGTQFKSDAKGNWTMEPYARGTLSDSERAIWCVIPLTEQEKILKDVQAGKPMSSTGIRDCK